MNCHRSAKSDLPIRFVDFHDSFSNNVLAWLETRFVAIDHLSWEQFVELDLQKTLEQGIPLVFGPGPHRPSQYPKVQARLAECWGKIPFLGVCLGMQFMAVQMGATLEKHPKPQHGSKVNLHWEAAAVESSPLAGFLLPNSAGVYHSLAVSAADTFLQGSVLGKDEHDFVMALVAEKQLQACSRKVFSLGFQFHPESFLSENTLPLLDAWGQNI